MVMNQTDYNRIRKLIDKLETEALENNVDISSQNFKGIVEKVIEKAGYQPEEYYEIENKVEKDMEKKTKTEDLLLIELAESKGVRGAKGDSGHTPTKEEVGQVVEEIFREWKDRLKGDKGDRGESIMGPEGPRGKRGISAIALRGKQGEPGQPGQPGEPGKPGKDADETKVKEMEDDINFLAEKFIQLVKGEI